MGQLRFLEAIRKMPLMSLPVRSTFVPLQAGHVLIAPGAGLSLDEIKSLGSVTDLIAPNLLHCGGIMRANSVFPEARKWGVPGAKNSKPEILWTDELVEAKWPYADELPMVALQGIPKVNEVVFFHRESKSLIVTDLCFNLVHAKGFGAWLILSLFGTYQKFAISKLFLRSVTDREAFKDSLGRVLAFDFENIILSHGDNVIGGARSKLQLAMKERNL